MSTSGNPSSSTRAAPVQLVGQKANSDQSTRVAGRMMAKLEPATYSPYREILGGAFESLHPNLRAAHLVPLSAEGRMDVEHGADWFCPVMVKLLKLPASGICLPVTLTAVAKGSEVEWARKIGGSWLQTYQRAKGCLLVEREGLGRVVFNLEVTGAGLRYNQVAMSFAGAPIPAALTPKVAGEVVPTDEGWHVQVTVTWRTHLICRYSGALRLT